VSKWFTSPDKSMVCPNIGPSFGISYQARIYEEGQDDWGTCYCSIPSIWTASINPTEAILLLKHQLTSGFNQV
jgi:hypothetical protein